MTTPNHSDPTRAARAVLDRAITALRDLAFEINRDLNRGGDLDLALDAATIKTMRVALDVAQQAGAARRRLVEESR